MYHARPSAWVEPLGRWAPGSLYLIEIPSDAEFYDNIVAFFVPENRPLSARNGLSTIAWTSSSTVRRRHPEAKPFPRARAPRARAGSTAASASSVVDFASEALASLNPEAKVEPVLSASSGRIIKPEMYKNLINRSWRLVFEFAPDPKQHPVEFRAKLGNQVLTETWLYQWSLPS